MIASPATGVGPMPSSPLPVTAAPPSGEAPPPQRPAACAAAATPANEIIVKLYDAKTAPNPRSVRTVHAVKGSRLPMEQVVTIAPLDRTPEFRAKNPMGTLPVKERDDGSMIAESVAICRYFDEVQPHAPLMCVVAKDSAVVDMW